MSYSHLAYMATSQRRALFKTFTRRSHGIQFRISVIGVHTTHFQRTNSNNMRRFRRHLITRRHKVVKRIHRTFKLEPVLQSKSHIRRANRLIRDRRIERHHHTFKDLSLYHGIVKCRVFIRYRTVRYVSTNRSSYLTTHKFSKVIGGNSMSFRILHNRYVGILGTLHHGPTIMFTRIQIVYTRHNFHGSSFRISMHRRLVGRTFSVHRHNPPFTSSSFIISIPSHSHARHITHVRSSGSFHSG